MMSGKIDKILENFKSLTETSGNGLGNFPRTAYGCVMNLACENGLFLVNYAVLQVNSF